ncbi:MAG: TSUP family transporter [Duodenibacillus sp.]|nr:TSUP family transporter [Duodenibacillus sp.]
MDVSLSIILFCCAAFFIAGIIDSIAGGGGLITVPSLLLCGVPAHFALGTGKLAACLGTLSAVFSFARNRYLVNRILPLGFLSAAIGSVAGSWCALQIDSALMGKIMVLMLPVGLVLMLASGGIKLTSGELPQKLLWLKVCSLGALIGAYDGFFGPGAGSFFLIGLHVLLKMDLVRASANSKIFNLASNFGAVCTFGSAGTVLYTLAIPCAIASILGNQVGARLAMRVGVRIVRTMLFFVLSLLLATLVYRFFLSGAAL